VVRYAALLLLSCAAIAAAGCGDKGRASPAGLRLQREDLLAVSHALQRAQPSVEAEVAASKAAWPLVANGLPANTAAIPRAPIRVAADSAAKVLVPSLLAEAQATLLTGPGAQLAGLFKSFSGLAGTGWRMIGFAIEAIEHGSAPAARFARANVALYIESVYDAHFGLAQIGRKLLDGYRKLGAAAAFGTALTDEEVSALAASYSEARDRLHPHVGVRLGS
jgi:phage tail protein X